MFTTVLMNSGSSVSTSMSNTSMPAKVLRSNPLPSMTGLLASTVLPSPEPCRWR